MTTQSAKSNKASKNEENIDKEVVVLKGSMRLPLLLLVVAILTFLGAGIEWTVFEEGYPKFSPGRNHFKDADGLVKKLSSEQDPVSQFVWGQFSKESQEALTSTPLPRQLQEQILDSELNKILKSDFSIYSDELFPNDLSEYRLQVMPDKDAKGIRQAKLVIVSQEEDGWRFRVFDDQGEENGCLLYQEEDLTREQAEKLEDLKGLEEDEITAQAVMSILGYTGLSRRIDEVTRNRQMFSGDFSLINRLLLEIHYEDEINTDPQIYDFAWFKRTLGESFRAGVRAVFQDIPFFIKAQFLTIWILGLCSLIPGIAGLIYRRAFWKWFLASFVILYLFNCLFSNIGWGAIGAELADKLIVPYRYYLRVELLLILLLLAYNLRRNAAEVVNPETKQNNFILGVNVVVFALGWVYLIVEWEFWSDAILLQIGSILILLFIGISILWQTWRSTTDTNNPLRKNIVVCFDGTWNQPGQKDYGYLAETNVFKLFKMLKGTEITSRQKYYASEYKEFPERIKGKPATDKKQIGFYYHGVGNKVENSQLGQLFGGAFGMGADGVVARAYLDVVRVYRPGDRIFVFGFSRGAAIARLFAGEIGRRGVPTSLWTLHVFGRHWTVWKSPKKVEVPPEPGEKRPFLVKVLGCWDTVGSFGMSKNVLGIPFQKINLLKDLTVSDCVKRAYHMVALDETRDAFVPTLMSQDPTNPDRIIEVWFSGSHCDVGGGFATDRLSDMALDFLLRHVSSDYAYTAKSRSHDGDTPKDWYLPKKEWFPSCSRSGDTKLEHEWGLYLKPEGTRDGENNTDVREPVHPDARGQLRESSGTPYSFAPRELPLSAVIYDSVFDRMKKVLPVYAPESLFNLNEDLVKKRAPIEKEVSRRRDVSERLREQDAAAGMDSREEKELNEAKRIADEKLWTEALNWSNEKLVLTKWSEYLNRDVDVSVVIGSSSETESRRKMRENLKPATELPNPPTHQPQTD